MPATGAAEGEATGTEKSEIKVVYDWASQMNPGSDNGSLKDTAFLAQFTFDRSHNLWKYDSQKSWSTVTWRGGNYIQFNRSGGGLYMVFEIYVPKTGVYTLEQKYTKFLNSAGELGVYLIEKENGAAFSESDMNAANKVLNLDCKNGSSGNYTLDATTATVNKYLKQGNYYIAYYQNGATGTNVALFGNLTLNGGEGRELVDFDVTKPEYLVEGETGKLPVVAYYSDATSEEYTGKISFESSDETVLSIDNNGEYEALSSGTAVVTVTANGMEKEVTFDIRANSGITAVYDYAAQIPLGGGTVYVTASDMEKFTFNSSHNLWASAGYKGGDIRFRNGSVVQLEGSGYWVAVEVYVPATGMYRLEQLYTTYPGSGKLDVYMIPKGNNTSFAESLINGKTPVLSQSCDGENKNFLPLATPARKEKVQLDAGYHYVVYKSNGGRAMFGNMTLVGGAGRALVDFDVIKPDYLAKGATGELSVVAYYSDATSEAYTGEVSYESGNEDILTVDENGMYEALSSGNAIVTVTAGGIEKDIEVSIKGKSGIKVVYNYAARLPAVGSAQSTEIDLSTFSFENSGGLWARSGNKGGDIRFRNGQIVQLAEKNYWFAMEVYVPKSGMYTVEQLYTTYPNSGKLDVYMIPKGSNASYKESLIAEKTPLFSQSCVGEDRAFTPLASPSIKENVYIEEGHYFVVYKSNGGRAMFGNLTLNGGEASELAKISFDLPNVMVKGDGGTIVPIGMMSDATSASIKDGYIFSSDNETVLSVDAETGEYTAVGKGIATVTVLYDIGRKIVTERKQVEVIEGSASERMLVYDFAKTIPAYGTDKAFGELSDNSDDGAYSFASASRATAGTQIQYRDTVMALGSGEWFAFEIDIPVSGIYSVNQKYGKYNTSAGVLEAYIIPKNGDESFDIGALSGIAAAGKQSCFDSSAAEFAESATAADFGVNFFEAGKYYVVYKANDGVAVFGNLTLDGRNSFKKIIVSAPKSIEVGKNAEIGIQAKSLDMSPVDIKSLDLKCTSSDQTALVIEIGDNNECIIYGENEGSSQVTITAKSDEKSDSKTFEIQVIDTTEVESVEIDVPDYTYVRASESCKFIAHMGSGKTIEIPNVVYEITASEPEGIVTVSENSITANAAGKITLKATADFKGGIRTATKEIEIFEGMSKLAPTYYTYEMRENARENAKKYSWAKSEVTAQKNAADKALQDLDVYYDMIIGEGIPRSRSIKGKGNPDIDNCFWCGAFGTQTSWKMDFINRPWKVQCSECKRLFPSNDFEDFLELGLDEQGYFSIDRARDAHHKMLFHKDGEECTCQKPETPNTDEWYEFYGYGNKEGYLYNRLYPDVGKEGWGIELLPGETSERWCVDDGFGYLTGKTFSGGADERFVPIAHYNNALLYGVSTKIGNLATAYTYTDETKYGVAAAILLDRLADVLPSYDADTFDTDAYQISDGGTGKGKIQGHIQDSYIMRGFVLNVDRVFPILKDEAACRQIIEYLNPKAEAMGLENKKRSADDIWKNWEENILLETFEAAKLAKIGGNFGTYQAAVVAAALVLDKKPESDEMMEWAFKSGKLVYPQNSKTGDYYYSGGNIGAQLVNDVDRDGLGNESSASYNTMWWEQLVLIAELTAKYGDGKYDLYQNVKFLKMLEAFADLVMVNSQTVHIGDCSSGIASLTLLGNVKQLANVFEYVKNKPVAEKIAKYIALYYNYKLDSLNKGIFFDDPEGLGKEIMQFVPDKYGFTESKMLGGYGFAALRAGKNFESVSSTTENNNLRDFWMYFGGAKSHRHSAALNLGIESYGLNMAPDLAYPSDATVNAERMQWTSTTLAHNTVTVDGLAQKGITLPGKPLHFDNSDKVKVMDASVPEVYEATSEYRRTIVMIEADDNVSYGIDFFRIVGGNEHIYSFHAQSGDDATVSGMTLAPQVDEPQSDWTAEDTSSYAGADVKYGPDPNPVTEYNYVTYYPRGTTWLRDVRRSGDPVNEFTADFKITDYNRAIKDSKDLHLSLTMVNDFALDEVALAKGKVPSRATNKNFPTHLEYMLAKRTGKNLDSLFTTVYQPYKKEAYISSVEQIVPEIVGGTEKSGDVVKAVKVTHTNGRVDYVIYATNENVTYRLENNPDMIFKGFVGVWTANEAGAITYSYKLGGDADIKGKISGFTEELSLENYIDIKPDKAVEPKSLAGKYIFVEHDGAGNAAYEILSAEKKEDGDIRLDIGTVTTVRKYIDAEDFDAGYIFNIAKKQKFVIHMAEITDASPVFEPYENGTVSANSTYEQKLTATSVLPDVTFEYIGRTLPRGASINAETGIFTWKPDSSQVGDNHVAITARDRDGRETTIHFTVTVYGDTTGSASDNNTSTENSGTSGEGTASGGGGGGGGGGAAPTPDKEETPAGDSGSDVPQEDDKPDDGENTPDASGETETLRFTDLGNHDWAADAINTLATDGIIKGTTASTFSPAANITRADFALLLVRAFKLESDNAENFADVTASDYFAAELAIARNTGLVGGIGDNKYAPRNNITRQDMMVIVYRAIQKLDVGFGVYDEPNYEDFATVASYARDAVSVLISEGLVNGKSGNIAPTDYTTRAEVAVLIKRIIEYIK